MRKPLWLDFSLRLAVAFWEYEHEYVEDSHDCGRVARRRNFAGAGAERSSDGRPITCRRWRKWRVVSRLWVRLRVPGSSAIQLRRSGLCGTTDLCAKMMILTPSEKPWVLLPSPFFN